MSFDGVLLVWIRWCRSQRLMRSRKISRRSECCGNSKQCTGFKANLLSCSAHQESYKSYVTRLITYHHRFSYRLVYNQWTLADAIYFLYITIELKCPRSYIRTHILIYYWKHKHIFSYLQLVIYSPKFTKDYCWEPSCDWCRTVCAIITVYKHQNMSSLQNEVHSD